MIALFLCFPIENSSNKGTNFTSCFISLSDISKITKLMKKKLEKGMLGISQEIWCSNWETGRFDEKLGDSRENRESWQVRNMCAFVGHNFRFINISLCYYKLKL